MCLSTRQRAAYRQLALAYVIAVEQAKLAQPGAIEQARHSIDKLLSGALGELNNAERSALADRARREVKPTATRWHRSSGR
jgi:hypothetical protein